MDCIERAFSYNPCCECQNKKKHLEECVGKCLYATTVAEHEELKKENRKMKITLFKHRMCPECGKQMTFDMEGNFGGTFGIFNCECGYKDKSYSNITYATEDDWSKFRKDNVGIMW